jgi:hypothetical protein
MATPYHNSSFMDSHHPQVDEDDLMRIAIEESKQANPNTENMSYE